MVIDLGFICWVCVLNMKYLSLTVQNLWPWLKFFATDRQTHRQMEQKLVVPKFHSRDIITIPHIKYLVYLYTCPLPTNYAFKYKMSVKMRFTLNAKHCMFMYSFQQHILKFMPTILHSCFPWPGQRSRTCWRWCSPPPWETLQPFLLPPATRLLFCPSNIWPANSWKFYYNM